MKKIIFIGLFLIGSFFANNVSAQTNDDWTKLMDAWCEKYFNDCFSGREYLKISVYESKEVDDETMKVTGYVRYKNLAGMEDSQEFYAYLKIDGSNIKVSFNKKSKNWFGSDYWEECSKTINLDDN